METQNDKEINDIVNFLAEKAKKENISLKELVEKIIEDMGGEQDANNQG